MVDASANRIRIVWLLPLVAFAISYGVAQQRRADATVSAKTHEPTSKPAPTRTASTQTRAMTSPAAKSLPTMPATGVPVTGAFDALAARARAGDAAAAERLLHELGVCQQRHYYEQVVSSPIPSGDASTLPENLRKMHEVRVAEHERVRTDARAKLAASDALCSGVTPEQTATLGEWLERAADSGDPGAQLCYVMAATSDGYAPAERFSDEWVDWMVRFRSRAHAYAENAFAAGYPSASLFLYFEAAGPNAIPPFFMDHDVPADPARAYALALLQLALIERNVVPQRVDEADGWRDNAAQLRETLDDASIARARAWADREAARLDAMHQPDAPCGDRADLP
jgi:hypothetical protein